MLKNSSGSIRSRGGVESTLPENTSVSGLRSARDVWGGRVIPALTMQG